jgi:hypothetical protein
MSSFGKIIFSFVVITAAIALILALLLKYQENQIDRAVVHKDGVPEVFRMQYANGKLEFVLVFHGLVAYGTQPHLNAAVTRRKVWIACDQLTSGTCDNARLIGIDKPPDLPPPKVRARWRQATKP